MTLWIYYLVSGKEWIHGIRKKRMFYFTQIFILYYLYLYNFSGQKTMITSALESNKWVQSI